MYISELIKDLQEFMDKHGDLRCGSYEEDIIGIPYFTYCSSPSLFWIDENYHLHSVEDKYFELDKEHFRPVCIV